MQVAYNGASWHCGVMVKVPGLEVCFVNLKVGGSYPLLGNTCTTDVFSLHPAVVWYFARLFITKRWLAFIHRTPEIQNPKFSTFWRFPPKAQNSWREHWLESIATELCSNYLWRGAFNKKIAERVCGCKKVPLHLSGSGLSSHFSIFRPFSKMN